MGVAALRWPALAAEPADADNEEQLDSWARDVLGRERGPPPAT